MSDWEVGEVAEIMQILEKSKVNISGEETKGLER